MATVGGASVAQGHKRFAVGLSEQVGSYLSHRHRVNFNTTRPGFMSLYWPFRNPLTSLVDVFESPAIRDRGYQAVVAMEPAGPK